MLAQDQSLLPQMALQEGWKPQWDHKYRRRSSVPSGTGAEGQSQDAKATALALEHRLTQLVASAKAAALAVTKKPAEGTSAAQLPQQVSTASGSEKAFLLMLDAAPREDEEVQAGEGRVPLHLADRDPEEADAERANQQKVEGEAKRRKALVEEAGRARQQQVEAEAERQKSLAQQAERANQQKVEAEAERQKSLVQEAQKAREQQVEAEAERQKSQVQEAEAKKVDDAVGAALAEERAVLGNVD